MAVHHAVAIRRQRNSGYRPSRINIMAQDLSTPDPSLSHTHLSIRRGRATTTHYTHHQVSLMVSRNTTIVPSLGLRIGPACETGHSTGMRRERVTPQIKKKAEKKKKRMHSADYAWQYVCPSVRPSVCLSYAGIVRKRLHISSKFFSPSGSPTILVFPY